MSYARELEEDARELEQLIASCERPKLRAMLCEHLTQLLAEIHTRAEMAASNSPSAPIAIPKAATKATKPGVAKPAARVVPPPPPLGSMMDAAPASSRSAPPPSKPSPPTTLQREKPAPGPPPTPPPGASYVPISTFGWDQDSYRENPGNVYVYIMSGMDGVGACKERVTCDFGSRSFDLKVHDFNGRNFRLNQTNLEKEIVPSESKVAVKKNRITVTLRKVRPRGFVRVGRYGAALHDPRALSRRQVKGEYGGENWMDLTAKGRKAETKGASDDPSAGIMDMMKQSEFPSPSAKHALGNPRLMQSRTSLQLFPFHPHPVPPHPIPCHPTPARAIPTPPCPTHSAPSRSRLAAAVPVPAASHTAPAAVYDDGDDNMRKIIGETMMKSREEQMSGSKTHGIPDAGLDMA